MIEVERVIGDVIEGITLKNGNGDTIVLTLVELHQLKSQLDLLLDNTRPMVTTIPIAPQKGKYW